MEQNHNHQPEQPQPSPSAHTTTDVAIAATAGAITITDSPTEITPKPINTIINSIPITGASQIRCSRLAHPAMLASLESVKRKRGRPRKYSTIEEATAAKRAAPATFESLVLQPKGMAFSAGGAASAYSKKSQFAALGNAGQGFTAHFFTVNAGEDVGQKIMLFMQQSKREICILSASGTISNASLRQPATSGGNINYEGRFDIVSLSGSYVRTEFGGRTGGLAVCLASGDGQIIGGGVGGPLIAAGPIQVIIGSFVIDPKDIAGGSKGEASMSRMLSPVGAASVPGISFRSSDTSHQNIGGSHYMMQPRGMHMTPPRSMDWRENTCHGMQQSPENGDYDQHIQD